MNLSDMKGQLLSAAIPSVVLLQGCCGSRHFREGDGMAWGGQQGSVELAGQMLRERMCRNLSGLIAWKLETLKLGS